MLATYAVADMSAAQAAEMPAGNVPSVLTAEEASSPAAPSPKSSKKASSKSSSSSSAASASPAQDAATASSKAAAAAATSSSKKKKKGETASASATTNGTIQGLQNQWQGLQDAAQRDPGISDFLKAAARFAEAVVRVGLIVLRLLVQVTAVLLQFVVKLLVWLLDWAGQRTADRVAAVRQQKFATLQGHAVVQQGAGQGEAERWRVAMAAAAEQAAPELHARAV
jgi:hypothetical protein